MRRPRAAERGLIFFAGQDWWYHNRAHSDMQLALQLATSRRVLLVNSIGTRMPMPGRSTQVRQRIARKARSVVRFVRRPVAELPNFYVYSPLSIPLYESRIGRRINTALLVGQVGLVRRWLRMTKPDLIVTPPTAWPVATRLDRGSLIFNRSDKHSAWVEVDQAYLAGCEQALLAAADLVLYVSHALMAEDSPQVGARGMFLDHGVDLDMFSPDGPAAPELDAVPRPRIGYFGALRDVTVDMALLERVADEIPDAALVLVGPTTVAMQALLARPNVFWFGSQPHQAIPAFGRGFDVALMPWLSNDWIRNCNPVKLKEYLALGLPVVTTDFPEAHRYRHVLHMATDADAFVALCREALHQSGEQATGRRDAVLQDSWRARGQQLMAAIDGLHAG